MLGSLGNKQDGWIAFPSKASTQMGWTDKNQVNSCFEEEKLDDAIESDGSGGRLKLLWSVLAGKETSLRGNAESEGSEEPARSVFQAEGMEDAKEQGAMNWLTWETGRRPA